MSFDRLCLPAPMYPVTLDIRGRLCVVVGGGAVAERKVDGLLAAAATVRVISPELTETLRRLAESGRISWERKEFAAADVDAACLVFAATDSPAVQAAVLAAARQRGCLVNRADAPADSDFHVPAVLRRGELLVSVSTSGASPVLAALLKGWLEREIGEEYAVLARFLAGLRTQLQARPLPSAEKKILFRKILDSDIVQWTRKGRRDLVLAHAQRVCGHLVEIEPLLAASWSDRDP